MSDIYEDDVDPREYEHSEKKRTELLANAGVLNEVLEMEKVLENSDDSPFEIKEDEAKKLCVYIRNYDSDGNLVNSPSDAIKTCIDTFEKTILKVEWEEQEPYIREDGTNSFKLKKNVSYKDGIDNSVFADEEILKVKPHIIESTTFLNKFIRSYFDNFNINKNKGGKTLFIEYHITSNSYKNYNLTDEDIDYFYRKNYDIIGLKLDNKEIEFNTENFMLECKTISFEDCTFKINTESGINFKSDYLYMSNISIDSKYKDKLATISCTLNKIADIKYIKFTNELCKFDFLNMNTNDMQRWMQSSVKMYGFEFIDSTKSYEFKTENILRFNSFYNVDISGVSLSFDMIDMHIMKFDNITNLVLGSHNFTANKFGKNLILLKNITNFTGCSIYATQNLPENGNIFLFHTSGGGLLGEHKYTAVITTNIGIVSSSDDNIDTISFNSIRCNKFSKPMKWSSGTPTKLILSNCLLDSIANLELKFPKISIYNTNITNINEFIISASEKCFISNSSFNGENMNFVLTDDASFLSDMNKMNFKKIEIEGESGTGNINLKSNDIKSKEINFAAMNKITSKDSIFKTSNISVVGKNINGFNPVFENNLKEIKVSGQSKNSLIMINNENELNVNIDVDSCKGTLNVISMNKTANLSVNITKSQVEMQFDTLEETIDNKIELVCNEDCEGSILTSLNENYKFIPKAEGNFSSLKHFKNANGINFKTKEWKEKVAYGYKSK